MSTQSEISPAPQFNAVFSRHCASSTRTLGVRDSRAVHTAPHTPRTRTPPQPPPPPMKGPGCAPRLTPPRHQHCACAPPTPSRGSSGAVAAVTWHRAAPASPPLPPPPSPRMRAGGVSPPPLAPPVPAGLYGENMAPFPEEVDVFSAPHWRMKQLVGLYCDKVTAAATGRGRPLPRSGPRRGFWRVRSCQRAASPQRPPSPPPSAPSRGLGARPQRLRGAAGVGWGIKKSFPPRLLVFVRFVLGSAGWGGAGRRSLVL